MASSAVTTLAQKAEKRLAAVELRRAVAEARLKAIRAEVIAKRLQAADKLYSDSYSTTLRSRIRSGADPKGGPADLHLDARTHDSQRKLSRDLLRNSPIARGFLNRLAALVFGSGMWPQAMTDDPEWNKAADTWFIDEWSTRCDVTGKLTRTAMEETLFKSAASDGDVLALLLKNGQVQLIEGERIRSGAKKSENGRDIVNGVEVDGVGRPMRFFIAAGTSSGLNGRTDVEPRAAKDCLFLRFPHMQWSSQTRGEPLFVTALGLIEDIGEFVDSTVVASRMATFLSLIIHTENPGAMQDSMLGVMDMAETGGKQSASEGEQKEEFFGPGGVMHLKPNEKVTQVAPEHPSTGFDTFIRMILRMVGMDIGLPYEVAALDFSVSNYYGNRAAMATAWLAIQKLQTWFQESYLTPLYRWRIAMAIEDGELPPNPQFRKVKWMAPTMPLVDPKAEIEALGMAIGIGVKTERDAIEQLGGDQAEVHAQRAAEIKEKKRLGIETGTVQNVVPPRSDETPSKDGSGDPSPAPEKDGKA